MTDYKKMHLALVDEVASTIDRLTIAMRKAEDIYIDSCGQQENHKEPDAE